MKLTRHTDYALRLLMHLGAHPERLWRTGEIAAAHGISEHHLLKVVQTLGRLELVRAVRGRGGGLALARPAAQIRLGDVVRATEDDGALVDCAGCVLARACGLIGALACARQAFFASLDAYTVADVSKGAAPLD